jgi:hypothetical protein
MNDEIAELKAKLDAMPVEARAQLKAQVRDQWNRDEAAAREREIEAVREHERNLLKARQDAALALVNAAESSKALLTEFHRANNALRAVLPLPRHPHLLDVPLADGIARLDVDRARAELDECKRVAENVIGRGGR